MKRLLFICLLFIASSSVVLSQSIMLRTSPELPEPLPTKHKIVPFVGFSIGIPLFKRYSDVKSKAVKKPTAPYKSQPGGYQPDVPAVTANEDGPIAWEYTGEAVTVYVPRYGGAGGGGSWNWSGGAWSYTYNESVPPDDGNGFSDEERGIPKPIRNARKVRKDQCDNGHTVFKDMYTAQQNKDKEQGAFITDRGIFWLNDVDNTHGSFFTGAAYEYGQNPDGTKWFYDNGVPTTILGIVHTHPTDSGPGVSQLDLNLSSSFNVPIYAIHTSGIWKGYPNGSQSPVSYNMNDAFDCATSRGTFGY